MIAQDHIQRRNAVAAVIDDCHARHYLLARAPECQRYLADMDILARDLVGVANIHLEYVVTVQTHQLHQAVTQPGCHIDLLQVPAAGTVLSDLVPSEGRRQTKALDLTKSEAEVARDPAGSCRKAKGHFEVADSGEKMIAVAGVVAGVLDWNSSGKDLRRRMDLKTAEDNHSDLVEVVDESRHVVEDETWTAREETRNRGET